MMTAEGRNMSGCELNVSKHSYILMICVYNIGSNMTFNLKISVVGSGSKISGVIWILH
jgi:hypothetical protein